MIALAIGVVITFLTNLSSSINIINNQTQIMKSQITNNINFTITTTIPSSNIIRSTSNPIGLILIVIGFLGLYIWHVERHRRINKNNK